MASIPNLLPALTGALQGYSSARGLDLARKLREQAALDDLEVQKFERQEEIKDEFSRQRRAELAQEAFSNITPEMLQAAASGNIAATAAGVEVSPDVADLSEYFPRGGGTMAKLLAERSGIGMSAAAIQRETDVETQAREGFTFVQEAEQAAADLAKTQAETVETGASTARQRSLANLYGVRAEEIAKGKDDVPKDIGDFKFTSNDAGLFATTVAPDGSLVTMQVPGVGNDTDPTVAKEAMDILRTVYPEQRQEAMQNPAQYAKIDPKTKEIVTDKGGIVIDWELVAQAATSRAYSMSAAVFKAGQPQIELKSTTHPSGLANYGSPVSFLSDPDLSPEEIQVFVDLEAEAAGQ